MSKRNIFSFIAMCLIGLGIFAYFLRDININVLGREFLNINWHWMLVAILCMFFYFGLESWIVKALVDHQMKAKFSIKDAIRVPLVEQFFNGITPFASGGQPGQLFVMVQSGIDAGRASSILLMKFIIFQAMIVVTFIFSLIIGFHYLIEKLHYLAWLVLLGFLIHLFVIVGLLLVMYWYSFTQKLINSVIIPLKWFMNETKFTKMKVTLNQKVANFHEESIRIAHKWRLILKITCITLIQLLFYYLVPYFIMLSLGYTHVNIVMILCLHVLIFMIISLFPIPGGSGGAEYSFQTLFTSYITSSSKLILALILWRLLTYYLGMILGAIALFVKPDPIGKGRNK